MTASAALSESRAPPSAERGSMNWNKILNAIDKVVDFIGCTMVLLTILCTTINIFSRWTIGRSLGELDEISLMAFVWAIYIGMGTLYNRNEHICMDFILQKLPYRPKLILTFVDLIIEFGISALVSYLAFSLMSRSFIRTTNVTHVPYAFLQASIALGFLLLCLSLLVKAGTILSKLIHKKDPFCDEPEEREGSGAES